MLLLLPIALFFVLVGPQAYTLPEGMAVTETHYSDPMALYAACGQFGSCVETDFETYCDMHLRQAANGEPANRQHELTHCAGRLDAPEK